MSNVEHKKIFSSSLAPMRGLTTKSFMDILCDFGEPDEYISEFLRVHSTSTVTNDIIDLIENRKSSRPLSIQLLGRDPKEFIRIAKLLQQHKIDTINLNFGCPMPKISKKGVGGALLTELDIIDKIISSLANNVAVKISVKTRIGYQNPSEFVAILEHLAKHNISALYLHTRTVKDLYTNSVNHDLIKAAKSALTCKIIANGDIKSAEEAIKIAEITCADGIMIGRAAISNPWIFRQINELLSGQKIYYPTDKDYMQYIDRLVSANTDVGSSDLRNTSALKKYVVPIANFTDPSGIFPYKIRRISNLQEFIEACADFFCKEHKD